MIQQIHSREASLQKRRQERAFARKQRRRASLLSVALAGVLVVGGTVAYLLDSTNEVVNTFTPTTVTTEIEENFDGTVKSNVTIENTSDISVYVRAKVVITWQDANGNVLAELPREVEKVSGSYPEGAYGYDASGFPGANWVQGADGFWYYTEPLAANDGDASNADVTAALIGSLKQVGEAPAGYYLSVEILSQAIQAEGGYVEIADDNGNGVVGDFIYAVEDAWSNSLTAVKVAEGVSTSSVVYLSAVSAEVAE